MLRPCLTCGRLAQGSRCEQCRSSSSKTRQTPGRGGGHRAAKFRAAVLRNAGWRCEAVIDGERCDVSGAARLQAHHLRAIADGGDAADPDNGRALCRRHHDLFERQARAA